MIDRISTFDTELNTVLDQYDAIIANLKSGIMPKEVISVDQIEQIIMDSRYNLLNAVNISHMKRDPSFQKKSTSRHLLHMPGFPPLVL